MYVNTEILFPNHVIPLLHDSRGPEWRELVNRVLSLPEDDPQVLAFVLMMIRLNGCMECETDSFRAMRGCDACAAQTLHRYKKPDSDLLELFAFALADVEEFLEEQDQETRRIA